MHAYSDGADTGKVLGFAAALAVGIAIALNVLFERYNLGPAWLVSAPTVAAAFGILYQLLDRVAWRWRWLRALGIVDTPVVDGRYTGQLVSSYQGVTLPADIEVEQTWTKLIVRFKVASSDSVSLTAGLSSVGRTKARLTYTFRNIARPGIAALDMNDHDGTAELTIDTETGAVSGRYYNFRGRQGTITGGRP